MEKHPEIPSELYGQWWKVISDEFGPIIEEDENEETEARCRGLQKRNKVRTLAKKTKEL